MKTNTKLMLLMEKWPNGDFKKDTSGCGGGPGVDGRPRPFICGGYTLSRNGTGGAFYKPKVRSSSFSAIKAARDSAKRARKK